MANEARVYSGLNIKKGHLDYRSAPTSFLADQVGTGGPVGGQGGSESDGHYEGLGLRA